MSRVRSGSYLPDRDDARLLTYDELFSDWEKALKFIVRGTDVE